TDLRVIGHHPEETLCKLVANAEKLSEHHLAKTLAEHAEKTTLHLTYEATARALSNGQGTKATVDTRKRIAGSNKLKEQDQNTIPEEIENYAMTREKKGNTAIFIAQDHDVSGVISIADEMREDAKQAVTTLRQQGVEQIIMLTGDNEHTAKIVAEELGLDN